MVSLLSLPCLLCLLFCFSFLGVGVVWRVCRVCRVCFFWRPALRPAFRVSFPNFHRDVRVLCGFVVCVSWSFLLLLYCPVMFYELLPHYSDVAFIIHSSPHLYRPSVHLGFLRPSRLSAFGSRLSARHQHQHHAEHCPSTSTLPPPMIVATPVHRACRSVACVCRVSKKQLCMCKHHSQRTRSKPCSGVKRITFLWYPA